MRSLENVDDRREHTQFMDDTIIRQVPFAREDDVCPLCGNHLSEHKTITVQSDYYPKYSFDFLYCPCCDIPFTNAEIGKQIKKQLHFGQRAFITKKNCTIENIRNMMSKDNPPPHKITGQNQIPRSKSTLKATDFVIWRYPKKLVSLKTICCKYIAIRTHYLSLTVIIVMERISIMLQKKEWHQRWTSGRCYMKKVGLPDF